MIAKAIIVAALAAVSFARGYGDPYGRPLEYSSAPLPYDFGYDTNDDYGTTTFRKESGDGAGRVQGSYGYKDDKGIERIVEYVADEKGFRAQVKTNEPGTDNQNPADVELIANPVVVDYAPQKYAAAPRPSYVDPSPIYATVPRPSRVVPGPVYAAPRPALRPAYAAPVPAPRPAYGSPVLAYAAPKVY